MKVGGDRVMEIEKEQPTGVVLIYAQQKNDSTEDFFSLSSYHAGFRLVYAIT